MMEASHEWLWHGRRFQMESIRPLQCYEISWFFLIFFSSITRKKIKIGKKNINNISLNSNDRFASLNKLRFLITLNQGYLV